MSPRTVRTIFKRFAAANPEPQTELRYRTPFQLLVAVVLSAQATDKSVNLATARLFKDAPTPQAIVQLGEEGLQEYIKTIGLYRSKARNVVALACMLIEKHSGVVPRTREELEALPGVGRKSANVILNVLYGEPTIAVDTHIFRLGNRTGLAPGKDPREVEAKLMECVPPEFRLHAHHWLILHGRYVCTALRPKCDACSISDLCEYPAKSRTANPTSLTS